MKEAELITTTEFAHRVMIGETKARQMTYSKELCDAGVSVRINPGKGGVRIIWPKYLDHIQQKPTQTEFIKTEDIGRRVKKRLGIQAKQKKTKVVRINEA